MATLSFKKTSLHYLVFLFTIINKWVAVLLQLDLVYTPSHCGLCWSKIFTPNSFNAFLQSEINMRNFESWNFESFKQDSFRDIKQTVLSDDVPQFTKHIRMPLKLARGQLTGDFINTIRIAKGQWSMGGHTQMWSIFKDLLIPIVSRKKTLGFFLEDFFFKQQLKVTSCSISNNG